MSRLVDTSQMRPKQKHALGADPASILVALVALYRVSYVDSTIIDRICSMSAVMTSSSRRYRGTGN